MKAPQRIHRPPTEPHEGWLVEDIFGERFFVYKGDWENSRTTYRWWIDQPKFSFERSDTWSKIHCEDTREACFRQIQEWEDLKVKKAAIAQHGLAAHLTHSD